LTLTSSFLISLTKGLQALDALSSGLVDWLGGLPECLTHISEFNLVQKAQPGLSGNQAYGVIKREMYRETIAYLENTTEESIRMSAQVIQAQREKEERKGVVDAWAQGRRAKL
jgi:Delta3-Delta2-enoyl-CoA isomerase